MLRILCLLVFLFSFTAKSQVLVNPSQVTPHVGVGLGVSKVEYQYYDQVFNVERNLINFGLAANLNPTTNFLLQLGYSFNDRYTEVNNWEGNGFMIGSGLNTLIYQYDKLKFVGYGLLNYTQEEYKYKSAKHDLTMLDLHLGGLVVAEVSPKLSLYCGPDFVPYSKGEIKYANKTRDIKRDDLLNFKVGMNIALDNNMTLKPEVTFLNEQTITVSLDF